MNAKHVSIYNNCLKKFKGFLSHGKYQSINYKIILSSFSTTRSQFSVFIVIIALMFSQSVVSQRTR